MVGPWEIIVNVALVLTALNIVIVVVVFLVYGKNGIYQGILWLYIKARGPLLNGATCTVFYLDPPGPWPGVCDICKFIDACEVLAWDGDEGPDKNGR